MTLLAKWRAWLRARLIADWARAHTFSSVQIAAIGALVEAFAQGFPGTATEIWNAMPDELRAMLPPSVTNALPTVMFVAVMVARLTRKAPADGQ